MQVLFVTSEVAPLLKTGGLGDVSAALPAALLDMSVDIRVLLPGYPQVLNALPDLEQVADFSLRPPSGLAHCPPSRLLAGKLPSGVPLWVFDCPELYARSGSAYLDENGNDWPDNARRFGLFSNIAALLSSADSPLNWRPDIVHCNDWQTGLVPAYLQYLPEPAPSVITIHNLGFQGLFPASLVPELGLPWDCYKPDGVEFYGNLSFLKAGLYYAQHITTVSPTYAKEIQTEELGLGLQGLLSYRKKALTGIINGIDTTEWNPAADSCLTHSYDASKLSGKAANKRELQKRMGLEVNAEIPLIGLVSRFAHQKGVDLVLDIANALTELPVQLVLLGSGDSVLQTNALALAQRHPAKIAAFVGFDEALSHQIEAGADLFLMPSRFEPCGLNQMYSQRYGTPPIVHATGGLIDTVVDCNASTLKQGTASGFVFDNMSAASLLQTIKRAVAIYRDKDAWLALQKNCMAKDSSWGPSAQAYKKIYTKLIRSR